MNIYKTDLFPYITGDSLVGKEVPVTIRRVDQENVTGHGGEVERKVVLIFQESPKPLILNKTNAKTIAEAYGPETDNWDGKKVILYSEKLKAFGEMHNATRVKIPKDGGKASAPPAEDYAAESAKADQEAAQDELLPW